MRSLLNRAVRVAYPFGVVRGIHRGPLRGMKYRVAPGTGFTYAWGIGADQWSQLGRFLAPGDCVYDIGANRGQSTLHLAAAVAQPAS